MVNKITGVAFFSLAILFAFACGESSDPPGDAVTGSSLIAESPDLKIELNQNALSGSLTSLTLIKNSEVGDLSRGGCMAWSIRKNAKVNSSLLQFLQCGFKAASNAGAFSLGSDETVYINGEVDEETTALVRLTESGGRVNLSLCVGNDSSEENMRVTLEESGSGYLVTGISIEENVGDNNETFYAEVDVDTTTAGIESYSFINYFVNETDADLCAGESGTSTTEEDNTCFLRYEGTLVNDTTDSDNPVSTLSGNFSEKNNAGVRTTAAAYSRFEGGTGATKFSSGFGSVNDDVNTETVVDSWTPSDFVTTADASLAGDVTDQVLPSRTVTLPVIEDPWNCEGEATTTITGEDFLAYAEEAGCVVESLDGSDFTSCTGPEDELTEEITNFLCDGDDPLIDTATQCPE